MDMKRGVKKDVFINKSLQKVDHPTYINTYKNSDGTTIGHVDLCYISSLPSIDIINDRLNKSVIPHDIRALYLMLLNPIEVFELTDINKDTITLNTTIFLDVLSLIQFELIVRYLSARDNEYKYLNELIQIISHSGLGYNHNIRMKIKQIIASKYNDSTALRAMKLIPRNLQRALRIEDEPINRFKAYKERIFLKIDLLLSIADALLDLEDTRYIFIEGLFYKFIKNIKIPAEFINICTRGALKNNDGSELVKNNEDLIIKMIHGRRLNVGKWYEFLQNLILVLEINSYKVMSTKSKSKLCTQEDITKSSTLHKLIGELQIVIADALKYADVNIKQLDNKMIAASINEKIIMQEVKNRIQQDVYNEYTQYFVDEKKKKENKALAKLFKAVKERRKYKIN